MQEQGTWGTRLFRHGWGWKSQGTSIWCTITLYLFPDALSIYLFYNIIVSHQDFCMHRFLWGFDFAWFCRTGSTRFPSFDTPSGCAGDNFASFTWSEQQSDDLNRVLLSVWIWWGPGTLHLSHLSPGVPRWCVTDSPIKAITGLLHSLLSIVSTLEEEKPVRGSWWLCGPLCIPYTGQDAVKFTTHCYHIAWTLSSPHLYALLKHLNL